MIEIPLTQNQVALIDDEDFELVSQYKWYALWSRGVNSFYAASKVYTQNGKQSTLLMHRLIMHAQRGQQVDHINHLTLDNRRYQLRLCSSPQNQHNSGKKVNNTSGYKGVFWDASKSKWIAMIRVHPMRIHLGRYSNPEDAYAAYCAASLQHHGQFANFG